MKEKEELTKTIQLLEKRQEDEELKRRRNIIIIKGLQITENKAESKGEFRKKNQKVECSIKGAVLLKNQDTGSIKLVEMEERDEKCR